jgi:hypothetical protein
VILGRHRRLATLARLAPTVALPTPTNVFRPFLPSSAWNTPAEQRGTITGSNPYASEFQSFSATMIFSGLPGTIDEPYAKPIYFATASAPVVAGNDVNGWPQGDLHYNNGDPIPVPVGIRGATGTDGHITIVSADKTRAWDMWEALAGDGSPCTEANVLAHGYKASAIAVWDLTGSGVPSVTDHNVSARESGAPLLTTTIRAEEAAVGLPHALGLTIPVVNTQDYLNPCTNPGDEILLPPKECRHGEAFVLRPDYALPSNAPLGIIHIVECLKTYGVIVVDEGSSATIDCDNTNAELWAQTGVKKNGLPLLPTDWRWVSPPG